ncbi:hypothetical protein E2C01_029585 [Portunus trituberculatus]|uniref:Uncharacterized protein n=1 Tax=Portunus trituberculatus TaxID=210409 RepID=A0A5B7ESA8_PORTR|nr:hypothetical protein [Portunus trituberculatus]
MFLWMVTCPLTNPLLLPSSSKLSITSLHSQCVQIKIIIIIEILSMRFCYD